MLFLQGAKWQQRRVTLVPWNINLPEKRPPSYTTRKKKRDLRRNFFAFGALPQQTATEGLLLSPWPQCYFNNIRCDWAHRRTCFFHALQFLPCWHCVQKSRLWAGVRKILWPALIETSPRPSEQSKHCQGDLRRPVDMSRLAQLFTQLPWS